MTYKNKNMGKSNYSNKRL